VNIDFSLGDKRERGKSWFRSHHSHSFSFLILSPFIPSPFKSIGKMASKLHVLIVGAGVGGLMLAVLLERANISYEVKNVEKRKTFFPQKKKNTGLFQHNAFASSAIMEIEKIIISFSLRSN
jgi:hypothetical protein